MYKEAPMTLNALNSSPTNAPAKTRAQKRAPRLAMLTTVSQKIALASALTGTLSACDAIDVSALKGLKDGQKRDSVTEVDLSVSDAQPDVALRDILNTDAFQITQDTGTIDTGTPDISSLDARTDGLIADAAIITPDAQMSADLGSDAAIDALAPDAAIIAPDAATVEPDAAIIEPDAAIVVTPDAAIISPDAFVNLDMGVADAEVDAVVDAVVDAATVDAFVPYVPCTVGFGPCRADGLIQENGECSATPGVPGVEICNNVDDDCDGHVDNNINPRNCATACGDGVFVCEAGGRERCTAIVPVAENVAPRCNGEDDNCDGSVDEGLSCDDGQPCQNGIGECRRNGVIAGGVCAAVAGNPTPDVCDGLDQNCDGVIDNGVTVLANGQRLTGSSVDCSTACGAGIRLCRAGPDGIIGLGACNAPQPSPEIIDGIDNDCDGQVDEGFGIGSVCAVGVGSCAINGVITRDPNQVGETFCDTQGAVPQDPTEEVCDGVDNDCDEQIDEAFPQSVDSCSVGVGACENSGLTICVNGALDCNVVAGAPQPEVCNQIDDNCDGAVDEELICFQPGDPCSVGLGVCLIPGVLAADGSCDLEGKVSINITAEKCNGLDDNCNGEVDEDNICRDGTVCSVGLGECQRTALTRVVNGVPTCDAVAGVPHAEICGGNRDEDCDGLANEDCQ